MFAAGRCQDCGGPVETHGVRACAKCVKSKYMPLLAPEQGRIILSKADVMQMIGRLRKARRSLSEIAHIVGIHRSTVHRYIRQMGIA